MSPPISSLPVAPVPPTRGPRRFALPRGRIAELEAGRVVVRGHDLRGEVALAARSVRAVATLADGSLLVVGSRATCVLPEARLAPDCYEKLTVTARLAWAWGDPASPRRFWLMESSFLGQNELPPVVGAKVRPITELSVPDDAVPFSEGRMARVDAGGVVLHGRRGPRHVALPEGHNLAHVAAVDGDVAWASCGPTLLRLDLSRPAAAVQARVAGDGEIVSLDADAGHVATLVAAGPPGADPRWSVVVRDAQGAARWRAATPFQPSFGAAGHLAVALGRFDPVVAVGDGRQLALWHVATGELIASRVAAV